MSRLSEWGSEHATLNPHAISATTAPWPAVKRVQYPNCSQLIVPLFTPGSVNGRG